jgi:hypothetical protein
MPHATNRYMFEMRIAFAVGELHTRLALPGDPGDETEWLFLLQSSGDFRRAEVGSDWLARRAEHAERGDGWIYGARPEFDYTWLEWGNIPRAVFERLMGRPFDDADFISTRDGKHQPYPESWGVMF